MIAYACSPPPHAAALTLLSSPQYMKALKATLTTSQPVISPDDFSTVFYRITELHAAHSDFLNGLKDQTKQWDGTSSIGELFRVLVSR